MESSLECVKDLKILSMQATVIHSLSDYTSLQLETKPIPVAVGNNIVVQIYAASINPVDGSKNVCFVSCIHSYSAIYL